MKYLEIIWLHRPFQKLYMNRSTVIQRMSISMAFVISIVLLFACLVRKILENTLTEIEYMYVRIVSIKLVK